MSDRPYEDIKKFDDRVLIYLIFDLLRQGGSYCLDCRTPTNQKSFPWCTNCNGGILMSRDGLLIEARRRRLLVPTGLMRL